ncbi:MAG: polyhydroxyalkanoate depolymerase [Oceanobacter sp.]
MLYNINVQIMEALRPVNVLARLGRQYLYQPFNPLNYSWTFRTARAAMELVERITEYYEEPAWELDTVEVNGRTVNVTYETVLDKPYCKLLHFKRDMEVSNQPKILMIAPISGHYATLLRGTVKEYLPDHEVYITDWKNARDVPLADGSFHFDDYVDYLMEFFRELGPDVHVMAVCQPCVPSLVAAAVMAEKGEELPHTMILKGGPVDVRINPTEVNDYATGRDLEWYEDNVICRVPKEFKGRGQLVYPGFIQLSGFMSMNWDTHINKHFTFFTDLVKGDGDSAEAHRLFYNEYLAVMDMPAHYYLDTIRKVFLETQLPKGEMEYRGKRIDLTKIENMGLMTIEGELDDITGRGQTSAALDLCSSIPDEKKLHVEFAGVGHYGIFNGRKFRELIAPRVKSFMEDVASKRVLNSAVAEQAIEEKVEAKPEVEVQEPKVAGSVEPEASKATVEPTVAAESTAPAKPKAPAKRRTTRTKAPAKASSTRPPKGTSLQ